VKEHLSAPANGSTYVVCSGIRETSCLAMRRFHQYRTEDDHVGAGFNANRHSANKAAAAASATYGLTRLRFSRGLAKTNQQSRGSPDESESVSVLR